MNCPLCQLELDIIPLEHYPESNNISCSSKLKSPMGRYNTHYSKKFEANWAYAEVIEEMIIDNYLIINHDVTNSGTIMPDYMDELGVIVTGRMIPGEKSVYVSIKKYNPNRMTSGAIKELRPGFERILTFSGYFHPDTEAKLKERLKLLLLLS